MEVSNKVSHESSEFLNVDFEMRNQLKLFVGERSKTAFDSGCKIFDVILHEPYEFDLITFQNFYTAYLTIKAKEKYLKDEKHKQWKIILKRYKLMENPHSESHSESKFTITKDMLLVNDLKKISHLRFILQQPSIYWKDFGIDEIRLKIRNSDFSFEKILDEYSKKCERTSKINIENLPPLDLVSSKLQNLWLICNQVSRLKNDPNEDNPRYDNNGSYEVNLLTYNPI